MRVTGCERSSNWITYSKFPTEDYFALPPTSKGMGNLEINSGTPDDEQGYLLERKEREALIAR